MPLEDLKKQARDLLAKSGFKLTSAELDRLAVNDFGLSNLPTEGFAFIDLLRSDFVRITLMILLPGQTLPQHKHPPYDEIKGKEESVRVLFGQFKVYVEGDEDRSGLLIPPGKERFYTARKEIVLELNEQFSVPPDTFHWFQAGPEGAVVMAFQNRVNEDNNIFTDTESEGCPIPTEKTGQSSY